MISGIQVRTTGLMLLAACMVFVATLRSSAQSFTFNSHEKSEKHTAAQIKAHHLPDTITVRGDSWFDVKTGTAWKADMKIKSTQDFVRFYVDHSYKKKIKFPYTYNICISVTGFWDSLNKKTFPADTLRLVYSPDSLATYQDLILRRYSNFHKLQVVITNMYSDYGPIDVDTITGLNFVVEGSISTQRYNKRYAGQTYYGSAGSPIYSLLYPNVAANYGEVLFNVPGPGITVPVPIEPANFELEWTYVDNYKRDIVTGDLTEVSASDLRYDFKNNATRVWLDTNYFRIPLIYQKGYIVYRIRMVRPDSVNYRYPIYGVWSAPDQGTVSSLPMGSAYSKINDPHKDDNINWQYTVSFAENGRYKHVLSYFDGLLKNRQSITRFNSTPNRLIATEQVYDFEGRPAISILPTPVPSTAFTYQQGLSKNVNTGLPYAAADFDTMRFASCPNEAPPAPLHSTALANVYYSSANPDKAGFQKFVPDAGGYPFVQTIYSAGYDKRIDRQGGAGDSLQIGFGHDTRNEYVGADQKDLNILMGVDAGWSGYYRKTVSTDPNGQVSVSVQDYKGRQVYSSLIGRGSNPEKYAIVSNDNVPDSSLRIDELIQSTKQSVVDNTKSLKKDFYMDVSGYDSIKYQFDFTPMPVCDPEDSTYLSVKAHYKYEIYDECGKQDLYVENELGTTGVMKTSDIVTASEPWRGVCLTKGTHSISKDLTVNTDEIYAAVDSLMAHPPGCFKDEPYFVKESVLKENFPCPADLTECDLKKREMMEELWPGKKYGKYVSLGPGVPDVDGGDNSIFTRYCENDTTFTTVPPGTTFQPPPAPAPDTITVAGVLKYYKVTVACKYRYQLCQDLGFEGTTFPKHMNEVDAKTFIYLFSDRTAERLLPLHPEYCKYKNCFDDTYPGVINSIPSAATAATNHRFDLDSIIAYDPILPRLTSGPIYFAHARDSLALYRGGKTGIDTMALMQAYCNSTDSVMTTQCVLSTFKTPISQINFVDQKVKEIYYRKMRSAYFSNRERFKSYLTASADSTCEPCDEKRMKLIPKPIFSDVFNADGSYNDSSEFVEGTVKGGAGDESGGMTVRELLDFGGGMTADSMAKIRDSAARMFDSTMLVLNKAKVDSIISLFANCTPNANLPALADTLNAIIVREKVEYGDFTPAQIRYAMDATGISITDLCNPYMITYEYHTPIITPFNTGCKQPAYYAFVRDFLNREPVGLLAQATATGYAAGTMTISTIKPFEAELYNVLFHTNISVIAKATADTSLYELRLASPTSDTVKFYFKIDKKAGAACRNILAHSATPSLDTFSFKEIKCISENYERSLGSGYIVNLSFISTLQKKTGAGLPQTCDLLSWNNKVQMTTSAGSLQECVPCTQMLSLYKQFTDSMNAYGVKGIDHPFHPTMLTNFMNEKLFRVFSWEQYVRFIQSCALADSLPITRYNGYAAVAFANDAAANTFINYINTLDTVSLTTQFRYKDDSVRLVLDFHSIPRKKMLSVRNHVAAYIANAKVNSLFNPPANSNFMGWLLVYKGTPFDSAALRSNLSATFDINPAVEFDVWTGRVYAKYKRYDIRSKVAATNAMISAGIAAVNQFIVTNEMAAYFINRRESTTDDEYAVPEKQSYLQYVYRFAQRKPSFVLDTIQAQYLQANVFPTRSPQYGSPSGLSDINNLYLAEAAHPGLAKAIYMLNKAQTYFGGAYVSPSYPEFTAGKITISGMPSAERLELFYCGDQTYWYRFFGTGDTLFNLFFRLPAYIPEAVKNDYTLNRVLASPGLGNSRTLELRLNKGIDTITVNGFADFTVGSSQILHDVLLTDAFGVPGPVTDTIENCERVKLSSAVRSGTETYRIYMDSIRLALRDQFYKYVMSHLDEKLYLGYCDQKHGLTLYYYDRAGNLTRTVPPAGVQKLSNRDSIEMVNKRRITEVVTTGVLPLHKKISVYEYNTLDKVIRQNTPDGGEVGFIYDQLGRIIFSQNAKQSPREAYTYTLYDAQGRITETGEVDLHCGMWMFRADSYGTIDSVWTPCYYMWYGPSGTGKLATPAYYSTRNPYIHNALNYTAQQRADYIHSKNRADVVYTVYDTVAKDIAVLDGINPQENLRKRVSCIKYFEKLPATDTFYRNYTYASHYSYDIAGNVKTLVHDYPFLEYQKQRYKTVDYDYDLASGKVNMLSYNKGWGDQFYQRYDYDDDNRVTKVETSADGYIWKRDAEYQYYQHGPLARASIGDLRVQGIDFAYTIQGWLKAVNGDVLRPEYEMGMDSFGNNVHAFDAAATAINYFKGDYKPIGTTAVVHTAEPARSLYNGNISRLSSDLLPFKPLMANFTYDQLNRIKYAVYDSMSPVVAGMASLHPIPAYKSMYDYDMDGNITRLVRRAHLPGADMIMDSMRYYYTAGGNNNRLLRLTDSAENRYIDDVDKFTDPTVQRYSYDNIGNVTKDMVSNQDTIKWNLYNKVIASENKAAKSNLKFTYDGAGHRVAKFQSYYGDDGVTAENNEYFVHDAQGNILAVYKHYKNYEYVGLTPVIWYGTAAGSLFVRGMLGDPTYIAEAIGGHFMREGSFEAGLIPRIRDYEAMLPPKPAMHYLMKDPSLTELLIHARPDWVDTLRYMAPQMGNPILIPSSFASAFVDQDYEMSRYVMRHFMATPDVMKRQQALDMLAGSIGSDPGIALLRNAHTKLELPFDSLMDGNMLATNLTALEPDADKLAEAVSASMIEARTGVDYMPFFDMMTMPMAGLVWTDPYYTANINMLTKTMLGQYGDRNFMRDFFSFTWSKSYSRLKELMGADNLYLVDYHSDPVAYLTGMSAYMGGAFLDTVIAGMDGMSLDAYDALLSTSLSATSLSTIDVSWYGEKLRLMKEQVQTREGLYLGEHHLYGSSRLGIKNYLEGQVHGYRMWRDGTGPASSIYRDTGSLVYRSPWYSGKLNELIRKNDKIEYSHFDTGGLVLAHMLGQKQYEVTNHLGNVLSTVSDNRYERGAITMGMNGPVIGDSIKVFAPAVPTSYDYYPFGMLMPGRYMAADTTTERIDILQLHKDMTPMAGGTISMGGAGTVYPSTGIGAAHASLTLLPGDKIDLTVDTIGAGAVVYMSASPGVSTSLDINADMLLGDAIRASVEESYRDAFQVLHTREIASRIMTMEGHFALDFVPSGYTVVLKLMYHSGGEDGTTAASAMSGGPGAGPAGTAGLGYSRFAGSVDVSTVHEVSRWRYVKVVKNQKDLYRFGFDGQEKVNEIYGRGTHYDFGERYYDARVGRFFSKDDLFKKYPYYTPYQFAGNTPIMAIDLDGLEPFVTITKAYHLKDGSVTIVADVHIKAKVINSSSKKDIDMNVVAANLQSDLRSALNGASSAVFSLPFSFKSDGKGTGTADVVPSKVQDRKVNYIVNVTTDVRAIQNESQIGENDWVFGIVDEVTNVKGMDATGLAKQGGKVAISEAREFGYGSDAAGRSTILHEFLHLLGADDIYNTNHDDKSNVMSNGRGMGFTVEQKAKEIWNFTIGSFQKAWKGVRGKNYERTRGIYENEHSRKQYNSFKSAYSL